MSIDALKKKYKDVVRSARDVRDHRYISMGPLSLNIALGDVNGVRAGRIVQIVGKESSGKSTLALDIIAQYQAGYDETVLYLDYERTFDAEYADACGVDLDRLLLLTPNSAEEGADLVEEFLQTGEVHLIVLDSIPAAIPKSEHDKSMIDSPKMASSAGFITRFCQRITYQLDNYDAMFIVINQLRLNFSTMSPEKHIPFGGMSLQYATSVRIDLERIKNEENQQTIRAFVRKSKVGSPRGMTEFKIIYGEGIDHAGDAIELAVEHGIVEKAGAWYKFGDQKCQGLQNAKSTFDIQDIRVAVLQKIGA